MYYSLSNKIKQVLTFFLITLLTSTPLFSQEKASIPDIEKTYLHTDRSTYVAGESVWYKAYTVYAYNNLLFNHSGVLYVELVSPDSKVVARNITKLVGGIGHGDFKLTKSNGIKKSGKYQIRAYTNWTRNFGNDFVFTKEIEIIDVFESQRIANSAAASSSLDSKVQDENITIGKNIEVQFFAEGGSLIENVSSVVAFKAVDKNGNPVKVQGQILDADDELITMFTSVHDGMGEFQLKPIKGKQYHAKITLANNSEIKVPLPKVTEQGYLLSSRKIRDTDILTIKTNQQTMIKQPDASLTIRYATRGITYFEETITLSDGSVSLQLPKDNLPVGVNQITLFDAELRPQSERLLYINKNEDINVELTTDKTIYTPREKVVLNVSSKNSLGAAVPASYSVASTDLNGVKDEKDYSSNISSYFLMESDIRGKVHNAGYYFDASNPNRFRHLDLLLLTQGWRDFLWKKERKVDNNPSYKAEKGIEITGKVKRLFGSKPMVGNTVTLVVKGKATGGLRAVTDDLGQFKFDDLNIIEKSDITLTTTNKKGNASGMFVLDTIFKSPIAADYKGSNDSKMMTPEMKKFSNTIYKKYIEFDVLPENVLDAVELTGKKLVASRDININNKMFNGYVVDENSPVFSNIFELLEYAVPSLDAGNREMIKFSRNSGGALIIVDQNRIIDPQVEGSDMVITLLTDIQPNEVIKIESDNSAVSTMMYGDQGQHGSIKIYTTQNSNSNFGNESPKDALQTVKKQIQGYNEGRIFYSPDLDKVIEKNSNEIIRNTLYWNPYVHPNTTGTSQIEYFNSGVETNVKVSLEGITASGIPVVKKVFYTIEK